MYTTLLGAAVHRMRCNRGLSQNVFGKLSRLSQSTISRIETGVDETPSTKIEFIIAGFNKHDAKYPNLISETY